MKVLLVNPWARRRLRSNTAAAVEDQLTRFPPLGLLYLAAVLQTERQHEVLFIDANVEGVSAERLAQRVRAFRPQLVGVQALSFTLLDALAAARAAKDVDPAIHVNLGGVHPTIYPEETARLGGVDSVTIGEGERTFSVLLEALETGGDLGAVDGIAFARPDGVCVTPPRGFVGDVDALPLPARSLSPYRSYHSPLAARRPATSMMTSRGCPHDCLFCKRPHMGKRFRAKSPERVLEEMAQCEQLGIGEAFVFDDCFTEDRARALRIATLMSERSVRLNWEMRGRVDQVDPELLASLAAANCKRIHYGVESGSQPVLDFLRKGFRVEQIRSAFKATSAAGIDPIAHFVIGAPCETLADFGATVRLAVEIAPAFAEFQILMPFPGTDLDEMAIAADPQRRDRWREFAADPRAEFRPAYFGAEVDEPRLRRWRRQAYRAFYLRPSYLLRRALRLASLRQAAAFLRAGVSFARTLLGR
jgi:radical SAM superfamily enzyme YgiQ (UPF0313 family)